MESGADILEQKRVAPLSTVSLDSTYDQGEAAPMPEEKRSRSSGWSWAPFVLLVGLILIAVGLVLALDRGNSISHGLVVGVDEKDPAQHSVFTSGKGLTAPQKKLPGWVKQMRNASELYVEGGNSNMSLTGVVFPHNDSDTLVEFDAMVTVDSGLTIPSRQFVALANGRGYKWTQTQLGYGDSIVTSGCLASNRSLPFAELDSVVSTANWTSDDFDNGREVNFAFNGANYTVSKDEDDGLGEVDVANCWLIESDDSEVGLHVCIPEADNQLSKADFEEVFETTSGCPQLVSNETRISSRLNVLVPLPLRKWYASYKA